MIVTSFLHWHDSPTLLHGIDATGFSSDEFFFVRLRHIFQVTGGCLGGPI